jgi:prepilin-type N-terminal cleavage/methylation domain-containing protein
MKKAFTLLELVFVIVVIGILSAIIIPRIDSNSVPQAAIQLKDHIRYTQHLAMVNDKFDAANPTWYRNRWQIKFTGNQYSIVSDNNTVFAKDPLTSTKNLQNLDLNSKYGVTVAFSGSCGANAIISFDHLGRPLVGDLSATTKAYDATKLMTATCVITLSNGSEADQNLTIIPETGYVQ